MRLGRVFAQVAVVARGGQAVACRGGGGREIRRGWLGALHGVLYGRRRDSRRIAFQSLSGCGQCYSGGRALPFGPL